MRGPALGDGAPEQALGAGHGQQRADAHRAGRLAEDRDVVGITAEGGDVVPHPLEGGDLVEQAEVGVAVAEVEEALGADAVVDRHADDAVAGEAAAVVRTRPVPTSNMPPGIQTMTGSPADAEVGRPDVEVQAVLTRDGRIRDHARHHGSSGRGCGGSAPKVRASRTPLHASTGCGGRSRLAPNGGAAIGDALERVHAIGAAAAHFAVAGPDDRVHVIVPFLPRT